MHWCGRWLLHRPCHLRSIETMVLVRTSYQTKHLSDSSCVFLLPVLNPLARFLYSRPTPKKGDLQRWTVLSSRHGQFGFRCGLRDLQNDASIHLRGLVPRDCLGALGQNVRPASADIPGPHPIARTGGRKILATIPTADAESKSETDCSHLVHDVYERAGFPDDYVSCTTHSRNSGAAWRWPRW
jgi:hypothetical protein